MKDQFVPYELALKLKELGFNEPCLSTYNIKHKMLIKIYAEFTDEDILKAPLWQQAFDWFREKRNIDLHWRPMTFVGFVMYYDIHILIMGNAWDEPEKVTGKTYEEVRLACLLKLIELATK